MIRHTEPTPLSTLADLPFGAAARVRAFTPGSEHVLPLMQLGLVPGARVSVIRQAPLGDPLEVDVSGARLALRRAVAATVLVEPEAAAPGAGAA